MEFLPEVCKFNYHLVCLCIWCNESLNAHGLLTFHR